MECTNHTFFFPDQSIPLGTGLINCGHETVRTQDYRWNGLHRGTDVIYVWQYTLAGRGAILLGGVPYPLTRGQAFFVRIPHDHIYYLPEDSESWEFLYVTLYGEETDRLGQKLISKYGNIIKHPENSRVVSYARELFHSSVSGLTGDRYQAALTAYEFLLLLFREQEQMLLQTPGSQLVDRVNEALKHRLSEPVSIQGLAEELGFSRSHFSRVFHEASGKTPQEYLQGMRMQLAIRILQTERKSIKETAAECGFEDASYFCRVFRQKFGVPPEQFRLGKNRNF